MATTCSFHRASSFESQSREIKIFKNLGDRTQKITPEKGGKISCECPFKLRLRQSGALPGGAQFSAVISVRRNSPSGWGRLWTMAAIGIDGDVPRSKHSTIGNRAFPVTSAPLLPSFKRRRKTELFKRCCIRQCPIIIVLGYGFALNCAVTWPWSIFALRHDSCLSFLLTFVESQRVNDSEMSMRCNTKLGET